jgi:hypothetical protein
MPTPRLDVYAKDAFAWRNSALFTYLAAKTLFETENMMFCFPAATLGHHAIEKYLKAALICAGFTIVKPNLMKKLVASGTLKQEDCTWGHDLVELGDKLAQKRSDFDLSQIILDGYLPYKMPMTLGEGLAVFNPFFEELRYPQELEKLEGVGPSDVVILDGIVAAIQPFYACADKGNTPP